MTWAPMDLGALNLPMLAADVDVVADVNTLSLSIDPTTELVTRVSPISPLTNRAVLRVIV